jgi:hypothetical protein
VATPYAEARKRGFKVVIQPRVADRRAGENRAEVASRRALDEAQHADAHALTAEQRAEAAAKDAAEAKACAEKAETGLGVLFKTVETGLDALGASVKAATADAGKALESVDGAVGQVEQAVVAVRQAKESADQAVARAAAAESVASAARVSAMTAEQVSKFANEHAKAAVDAAQRALVAAQDRGVQVTGITIESRTLVLTRSDGTQDRIQLPDEGRRGRGGTGVGGGLNRTKVLALIEESMNYSQSEVLDDQDSTGSVLTFTFSRAVDKVVVELHETGVDDTAVARVRTDGTAPGADTGILIHAGVAHSIPDNTATVKVLADNGKTVSVWGYRR